MMTQRLVGHYYGDLQGYRPRGELAEARQREPIARLRQRLVADGVAADTLTALEASAAADIARAAETSLAAPLADPATVMEHLYA